MNVLDRIIRLILGERPRPRLTEAEVVAIAQAVAEQEGWTWLEPALVSFIPGDRETPGHWEVVSNAHARGTNVRAYIDDATGSVTGKGFLPR